ncbi:MAG: undecaprenyl-phosphate glucose phosphotransferase, partial [Lachnospiraceae bacterium]
MIKGNQALLSRLHVVLDAIVIAFSYLLSWFILFGFKHNDFRALPFSVYITALAAILLVYMLLNSIFELYAPKRILSRRTEFTNIFKANTIGFMIFTLVLFLGSKNIYFYHFSRRLTVLFYVLSIVFMTIERNAVRMTLRSMSAKGYNLKHILLVGYSRAAEAFID